LDDEHVEFYYTKADVNSIIDSGYSVANFGNTIYKDFMDTMREQGHSDTEIFAKLKELKSDLGATFRKEGVRNGKFFTVLFQFVRKNNLEKFVGRTSAGVGDVVLGWLDKLGIDHFPMFYKGIERNGGMVKTFDAFQDHLKTLGGFGGMVAQMASAFGKEGPGGPVKMFVESLKSLKFAELAEFVDIHGPKVTALLANFIQVQDLINSVGTTISNIPDSVKDKLKDPLNNIGDKITGIFG